MRKKIVFTLFIVLFLAVIFMFGVSNQNNESLTVYFDALDGRDTKAITIKYGDSIVFPKQPKKENYIFLGWYLDNETFTIPFNLKYLLDNNFDNSKIVVYAKWICASTLIFDSKGGSKCENITITSSLIDLPLPQKEGYTFAGWYFDDLTFEEKFSIQYLNEINQKEVTLFAKWKTNFDTNTKTIIYFCEDEKLYNQFEEKSEFVDNFNKLELYKPQILGYQFNGWYSDKELNNKVENEVDYYDFDKEINYLYASFNKKEVESLSLIGNIKSEYEYGESFQGNDAKVLIEYKDDNFEDEIVELTSLNISNFKSVDLNNLEYITSESLIDNSIFYSYVVFEVNGVKLNIPYSVKTDLDTFCINEEDLIFNQGEECSLSDKNIFASWTNLVGESDKTKLENYFDTESALGKEYSNYYLFDFSTNECGTFVGKIRFRFKTISVKYTVVKQNTTSGNVLSNKKIFLYNASSLENEIIKINFENEGYLLYKVKKDDIVLDINTTNSGWQVAKIMYKNSVIDVNYFVINLDQIISCEIAYGNNLILEKDYNTITIKFILDGYSFTEIINSQDFINKIDTSSIGQKQASFKYLGYVFYLYYTVN